MSATCTEPTAASSGAQAPTPSLSVGAVPKYILTTTCPDTTGVVAAIAGFLAERNASISEAQHHDGPYATTSFMRTVFHDNGRGMPAMEDLDRQFAERVGAPFGMQWRFHAVRSRCRVLLAVSRQDHCLNSILHRRSTGARPIEVAPVPFSQDAREVYHQGWRARQR